MHSNTVIIFRRRNGSKPVMLYTEAQFKESRLEMGTAFRFPKVTSMKNASVYLNIVTFSYFLVLCLESLIFSLSNSYYRFFSRSKWTYTQEVFCPYSLTAFYTLCYKTDTDPDVDEWKQWQLFKHYWKARSLNCSAFLIPATAALMLAVAMHVAHPCWQISQNHEKEARGWRQISYGVRDHIHYSTRNYETASAKNGAALMRKEDFKSIVPTLLMCSCCCWNCCLCFSKNCWCCCWITNCWRAWAFWGRGADCVRPSGRCCRSLCIEGETRSPLTRDCAWRGSPERYQSEDNMEEKTAEKKKRKKKGREKTTVE